MARAKRTERAEARRRYRAATAADPESEVEEGASPSTAGARPASSSPAKAAAPTVRTGFSQAFRQSFRPLNVREDVASLPWLAIHTKALWLPLLITFGSTVYIVATGGKDTISEFMFAYFIQTPAIGSVFLAGFLAPRSSWLLGAIIGFLSAICYAILILVFPTSIPGGAVLPTEGQSREVVISALILSPVIGSFFAAAAAWYRRFLALSSPNRARKASQTPKQKPGDGRTRAGSTQKAGAKR